MKHGAARKCIAAAVFAIASAAAIGIMVPGTRKNPLQDGTFSGTADGRDGPIEVSVTVKDGKIRYAKAEKEQETDFAKPAIQEIIQKFNVSGQTSEADIVSGATITSKATIAALQKAVNAARGKTEKIAAYGDTSCDIVIIGAGGAGLAAATEAASKGAKTIVLEKMGIAGGNTNSATGGLNASETSVQKKLGIEDSNEQFFQDTMKGGHNKNNPELVHTMTEKSAETVDWLISLGADLSDVGKMAGSTNRRTHRPQGGAAVGTHLVSVLEEAAKKAGAEIRYGSKVTDVIEKNGKACGVTVSSHGSSYTVSAKAVIIATGGFGANPEMVVSYKSSLSGFGTTNHKGATGDAFAWIQKFGGELVQMDEIQTHPTVIPGNGTMITEAVRGNGAIIVNRDGKRFCPEMATRDVMSKAILEQDGKTAFLVFDQDVRASLKAIEGYVKSGLLTQAESLAELAQKLGIPEAAFEKTMADYAEAQKSGNDPLGRKASEMPRPLTTPPFYAVEIGPAIHHTMGGIAISTEAQVLTSEGTPVPGLFAAGEVTGGIHGGNRLGGNAVADICIFGKIAADSALSYIQNNF